MGPCLTLPYLRGGGWLHEQAANAEARCFSLQYKATTGSVANAMTALKALATFNSVQLICVPGHWNCR